jgi:hypothetical protein
MIAARRRTVLLAAAACAAAALPSSAVAGTYGAQRSTGDVLTAEDLCAVRAALGSGDARRERVAREVLAGSAGALALGDPSILHHHGLNTAARCVTPEGALTSL